MKPSTQKSIFSKSFSQEVLVGVQGLRSDFVQLLSDLVRIESPTPDPEAQIGVFERLARELRDLDFQVKYFPGRRSGGQMMARPARRFRPRPYQLLLGHSDTVWPVGMLEQMPLTVTEKTLKGPGAFDMKAGLASTIVALKCLRELKMDPHVTPVLFINSDEELGSEDSERTIRLLARCADRTLVLEPASGPEGLLKTARKGVGQFTIRIRGRSAHAGVEPEAGVSAILELAHLILEMEALNDPTRGVTVNVGVVEGGSRPNVVAQNSVAVVDVRVPTIEDAHRLEKRFRSLHPTVPGIVLETEGGIERMPLERTPRNRVLWNLACEAASQLGIALGEEMTGGGSDGNIASLYTATLDGLGAVGSGAHALHEQVDIDRTLERSALLAMLLSLGPLKEGTPQRPANAPR
ncbi:MAG TPA: M20 family metallopeptidase [Acidobacteriota bacterium]|nr:M20 family metallopeptidase [Acidobacteriota bacterium]